MKFLFSEQVDIFLIRGKAQNLIRS